MIFTKKGDFLAEGKSRTKEGEMAGGEGQYN